MFFYWMNGLSKNYLQRKNSHKGGGFEIIVMECSKSDYQTSERITNELIDRWQRETMKRHFSVPSPRKSQAKLFSKEAERLVQTLLEQRGYQTSQTTYKCPFDLWADHLRIEVKASNWGGRGFKCNTRNQRAESDVIIFACKNGSWNYFIIPSKKATKTIHITSYHVENYHGKWTKYLEAWHIIDKLLATIPPRPKQLRLSEGF